MHHNFINGIFTGILSALLVGFLFAAVLFGFDYYNYSRQMAEFRRDLCSEASIADYDFCTTRELAESYRRLCIRFNNPTNEYCNRIIYDFENFVKELDQEDVN